VSGFGIASDPDVAEVGSITPGAAVVTGTTTLPVLEVALLAAAPVGEELPVIALGSVAAVPAVAPAPDAVPEPVVAFEPAVAPALAVGSVPTA
jgi:hypothetical protein